MSKKKNKRNERLNRGAKELRTLIAKEEQEPITWERLYQVPHYQIYMRLAEQLNLTPIQVRGIVGIITEEIIKQIIEGNVVSLYGFGQFKSIKLRPQIKTSFGRCRTFVPETTIIKFRTAEAVKLRLNYQRPIKLTQWQYWDNEEEFEIYDDSETFEYPREYKPRKVKNGNKD